MQIYLREVVKEIDYNFVTITKNKASLICEKTQHVQSRLISSKSAKTFINYVFLTKNIMQM